MKVILAITFFLQLLPDHDQTITNTDITDPDREYQKLMIEGATLVKNKKFTKAFMVYKQALMRHKKDSDLYYNLSVIGELLGKWKMVYLSSLAYFAIVGDSVDDDSRTIKKILTRSKELLKKNLTSVVFKTEPDNADVYLDGLYVGTTPVEQILVPTGNYMVTIRKNDFKEITESIQMVKEPWYRTWKLEKILYYGELKLLIAPPDNVSITIDGNPIIVTPSQPVKLEADRKYLLKVEKQGYDIWQRFVVIPRNSVLELVITLEKKNEW